MRVRTRAATAKRDGSVAVDSWGGSFLVIIGFLLSSTLSVY